VGKEGAPGERVVSVCVCVCVCVVCNNVSSSFLSQYIFMYNIQTVADSRSVAIRRAPESGGADGGAGTRGGQSKD